MSKSIHTIGEFLPGVLERVRRGNAARRGIAGVATGLRRLDELTGGWHNGDLIVIGGRPSMGKTALACQFALHAALNPHVPVLYLSLDLSRENLALRLTAAVAGVDLQRLRTAHLDAKEWKRVEVASQQLASAPICLDDTAHSISDLCTRAQAAANENRIGHRRLPAGHQPRTGR
ncbi:MAG: DnaB-like helicase C-terminal domain-containing protein [Gammaproteobacteria bacterium]|nr:DnaB-like helicase C-terminal domain-containing protein [Gammaproteobacteria bacterium]